MTIPAPEEEASPSPIPSIVAELPQPEQPPEAKPFLISFAKYNMDECGIKSIDPKRARKSLLAIRDVGMNIRQESDFAKRLPRLKVVSISNSGEYRKLYRGLADLPDTEVKEFKTDRDKGRLFFFVIDRVFYILSITDSHYETDKQRR